MASTFRPAPSSFPERLRVALDMRERDYGCPSDVAKALATIPYFSKVPSRGSSNSTSRFSNLGRSSEDWRNKPAQGRYHQAQTNVRQSNETSDGFEVWNGNRRRAAYKPNVQKAPVAPVPSAATVETPRLDVVDPDPVAKFSSSAIKSSAAVEDRMLARVKGKINKIGPSTYEATKVFMQQILDSDETGFLDDFMRFVFQKAATESAFCSLYAKLLHELADQFTHLRTVMTSLFRDYIEIFKEVAETPDVGTSDYRAFVEAQERKKFRRGYSQFVGELVKFGEADVGDFSTLIHTIVGVIELNYNNPKSTLLCEEYIDCLANLCNSAPNILSEAPWSEGIRSRLDAMTKKSRADVPGLTNKGRFALMDLVDSASRGWK